MRRLFDWLRWTRSGERELADEIRVHLALETERLMAEEGLPRADAQAAARRRFGNLLHAAEDSRAVWTIGFLDSWMQDARFGLRLLARNRLFTLVAVLSLAVGIGAGIAGFHLLDGLLIRALPVPEPHQLMLTRWVSPQHKDLLAQSINGWLDMDEGGRQTSTSFSYPAYLHVRDAQRSFSDLVAFAEISQVLVRRGSESDISTGQYVSGNYFSGLGVRATVGRVLGPFDDRPNAEPAAMISFVGWQRRFGGSPSAVGSRIVLNQTPVVIVGVMPRGFDGCLQVGTRPEFTLPIALQPAVTPADGQLQDPGYWWLQMMGRLKPGVPRERGTGELAALFDRHVSSLPVPAGEAGIPKLRTIDGAQGLVERRRELTSPLAFVAALVALVLLVAGANVAGLLLARGTARSREMAMRLAIGAGRARLARQMMTESVMLGLLGGAAGLVLAAWIVPLLATAAQPRANLVVDVPFRVDARLAAFAAGLSLLVGVVLGLVTIAAGRFDVTAAARQKSTTVGDDRPRMRLGKGLVAAQIALSMLFLVLAGLFGGTLRNLRHVQTGVEADDVLSFRIEPGLQRYEGDRRVELLRTVDERVRAIPGVRSAGFSRHPLFAGSSAITTVLLAGGAKPATANGAAMAGTPIAWLHAIGGRFLDTLGVCLLAGRAFDDRDGGTTPRVALVNRAFAKRFFGSEGVVGRTIANSKNGPPITIVGLVGDARYTDLRTDPPPCLYVPFTQRLAMFESATFYIRTHGNPGALVADVRRVLRAIDPSLPVLNVSALVDQISRSTDRERRVALTATCFGGLSVLLAGIGLYGVMAYTVSRRTRELGVRLALGASPKGLVFSVLRESVPVVLIGVTAGLAAVIGGGRFVRSQLFGLQPTDASILVAAAIVVALVSLAASYAPARRASAVDPLIALRSE